jgi:hypothetical protein
MVSTSSQPSLEVDVLRAMLRLARRRTTPTLEAILLRVPADEVSLRSSMNRLIRANLVHVTPKGPRLTLVGFAVAVAMAATPRAKPAAAPARAVPLTRHARRRRAA